MKTDDEITDDCRESCSIHCRHCDWVDTEIEERKRLRAKWDKVFWAAITTFTGGAVLSFFGLLAWAIKTYIQQVAK